MNPQANHGLTMATALKRAAALYGNRPAILDREGDMTWSQYVDRIARAAHVLRGLGLRPGERFGIISRNSFRHAELINAGYWLGAVPVPVNFRLAPPEIRYILDDAQCRLLALEDRFTPLLDDAACAPWRDKALYIAPARADVRWPQYEPLLGEARAEPIYQAAADDDAILIYTGGTTGRSKGVRLSHGNLIANAMQLAIAARAYADDRFLHVSPMFHSADFLGTPFTLVGGAHSYLADFTPRNLLDALATHRITVTMLAPTVIILTLQEPEFDRFDLGALRLVFYGSAPMAVEWIKRTMDKLPNAGLEQLYGLTETSPILTALTPEEHRRAITSGNHELLRSVGKPLVQVDLRIVDNNDRELPPGAVGEIVVRGPNVTKGYLGLAEQNAKTFRNGWLHTGDVGRLDAENNLYLLDRLKDMIITGGENVYSSEVEAALYKHPGVHEAAVVGVPDATWGEAVFAVIVPAPGQALTEETIIEHCRRHIGGYKVPRRMAFVPALPKSAMGKILKTELRKTYGGAS
ncbi:MAG: class I adenylate-forming enzyme family protein [Sulfurifustis sp.]